MSLFVVEPDGRLSIDGVRTPTRAEAEEAVARMGALLAERERAQGASILASFAQSVAVLEAHVLARRFEDIRADKLVALSYRVSLVRLAAAEAGSEQRLILALLLRGLDAGRGNNTALAALWLLIAGPGLQRECERRVELHPVSASVGTLAAAMRNDQRDGEHLEAAVAALDEAMGREIEALPRFARRRVSSNDAPGQAAETVARETASAQHILDIMARAMRGEYEAVPKRATADLENAARRFSRRRAREVVLDVRTSRTLLAPAPPEDEFRESVLEIEAEAVLGSAEQLERAGNARSAQRQRKRLYEKLGGKARRTPEIRKRKNHHK